MLGWAVRSASGVTSFRRILSTLNLNLGDMVRLYGIIAMVIVCLVVSWGLFVLKPWARVTAMGVAGWMGVQGLFLLFGPGANSPESPMPALAYRLSAIPVLIVSAIVIYFLGFEPDTKAAFKTDSLF